MRAPCALLLVCTWIAADACEPPLRVAVASNFHMTATEVAAEFTASTGIEVALSSGSTGKLYAQIINGAPFDVFLAADIERPERLVAAGRAPAGALRVYAIGQLVLWSADPNLAGEDCLTALRAGSFRYLALPNPATAPYGAAAQRLMTAAGIAPPQPRIALAESVTQAWQFVAAGNATLGFAALAQLRQRPVPPPACLWRPSGENAAVPQAGVVLSRSRRPAEARQFLAFFSTGPMESLLTEHGYALAAQPAP